MFNCYIYLDIQHQSIEMINYFENISNYDRKTIYKYSINSILLRVYSKKI
jgi:hypothetical protein